MRPPVRGIEDLDELFLGFRGRVARRSRRSSPPRRALFAVLVAVAGLVGTGAVVPVAAQTSGGEEVERDRAETRRKELSSELNELEASDEQLKAELDRLATRVKDSEAHAVAVRAEVAALEVQLVELEAQVKDATAEAAEARQAAAARAVDAYMRPDRENASQVLSAKDPQQFGKMHLLVTHVAQYNYAIVHHRESAELQLRVRVVQVEAVRTRSRQLAQEAEDEVVEAARLRDRQAVVRDVLDKRIAELKHETTELAAQEAALTAILAERQAQTQAELVVAPVATEAPTTTVAPTTTATTAAPTTTPATTSRPGVPTSVTTTSRPTTTVAPTTTRPGPTVAPTTRVSTPPTTRPPGYGKGVVAWPLSGPVTSGYGYRWGANHKGIDIGVPTGTPIMASKAGVVFFSGEMSGYGNVILIDHGGGLVTLYAHQSQLIAAKGASVAQGQTIGLVGSTGRSTGPHLHFEVRINGVAYDPLAYLP